MKSAGIAANLTLKLNEIEIDGYFKGDKLSNMAVLKIEPHQNW